MNLDHPLYKKIEKRLSEDFPETKSAIASLGLQVDWDHLISPFSVQVSPTSIQKIRNGIQAIHSISRLKKYQESIERQDLLKAPNESVLMSYDFHTSADGRAALIEINTNASGYLIAGIGIAAELGKSLFDLPLYREIETTFKDEAKSVGLGDGPLHVAIVDEDIPSQKMRVEFLLYQELFRKWGWSAEICESKDLKWNSTTGKLLGPENKPIQFVYNRLTDFLLERVQHQDLKTAWERGTIALSPQPKEYLLLADKTRLMVFQDSEKLKDLGVSEDLIQNVQAISLPTFDIDSFEDTEELWKKRKELFFKPKNSYGGKAVYRGESVSRKVFERLLDEGGLVQSFFPAQKLSENREDPLNIWKFDLRCYVYRDHIELMAARVYQGQVTNFSSRMGGFSSIQIG